MIKDKSFRKGVFSVVVPIVLIIILLITIKFAIAQFLSDEDINMLTNDIINASDINATRFFGDGSGLTGIGGTNFNSTGDGLNSTSQEIGVNFTQTQRRVTGVCASNSFSTVVTEAGGLTCAVPDTFNSIQVNGDINASSIRVNSSNVAVAASCAVDEFVVNTTAQGVQCVSIAASTDTIPPFDNSSFQTFLRSGFPTFVNISNFLFVNGTSGLVGINTTVPSHALTVAGDVNITGDLIIGNAAGDQILVYRPGSDNNPSYSFAGDTDTGFYSDINNIVSLSLQSTEKYRFQNIRFDVRFVSTQATPGLIFNGDTNTGLFGGSGDALGITAGAVEFVIFQETTQDITVFNEDGVDIDFRIESDNNENMFFIDAAIDMIGINTSSPSHAFSVVGDSNLSGFIYTNITSCTETLETDSNGKIVCGTDQTIANLSGSTAGGELGGTYPNPTVDDDLTISGGVLSSNSVDGTWTTTATLTIGDGGDRIDISSDTWDVVNGVMSGVVTLDTGQGANELYDMNQNVQTSNSVQFVNVNATGDITGVQISFINSNQTTGAVTGNSTCTSFYSPSGALGLSICD